MPALTVVMYHYVGEAEALGLPRLRSMDPAAFAAQVDALRGRSEPATLDSALAFLAGTYESPRDLFLLTFDDGLRGHAEEVFPILRSRRVQGIFLITTSCLEDRRVLGVHKNQLLAATLDPGDYARAVRTRVADLLGEIAPPPPDEAVRKWYRWDAIDTARFKYFLNFQVPAPTRDAVLDELFARYFGDESGFSQRLYLTWPEVLDMQADGMLVGGHSHRHEVMAELEPDRQRDDLAHSLDVLRRRARPQPAWPFSYPFGNPDSFTPATARILGEVGYRCAFARERGANLPGQDIFRIHRVDPKDIRPAPA
jgi:peptidoglycan/xylan/chitin deacetylase (PgdA/CDA1 family)